MLGRIIAPIFLVPLVTSFNVISTSVRYRSLHSQHQSVNPLQRNIVYHPVRINSYLSSSSDKDGTSSNLFENVDIGGNVIGNIDKIAANVGEGEWGKRGEIYVLAQALLVLGALFGGIPFIGDTLLVVLGPSLFLVGAGVIVLGLNELGSSLSPWPVPAEKAIDQGLITSGIFSKIRHPIYSGLICCLAGLSITTASVYRLLFTIALYYCLDIKSDFEEKKLMETFSDYEKYKKAVPDKFFPDSMLPWSDI
mmetsp:Transcript_29521/g.43541  ORF Transcript_29521/g.43541 Transcript_29521/m.43541 type:complete len:251 (+) Transcript_29521:83-835(+)